MPHPRKRRFRLRVLIATLATTVGLLAYDQAPASAAACFGVGGNAFWCMDSGCLVVAAGYSCADGSWWFY